MESHERRNAQRFIENNGTHYNTLISQFPQCIAQISHNAPFYNRNVHKCTFLLQNGALWDMWLVHCGICATGLFKCTIFHHTLQLLNTLQVTVCHHFSNKPLDQWMWPIRQIWIKICKYFFQEKAAKLIVPFHKYFSPSGEQLKHHKLAHEL